MNILQITVRADTGGGPEHLWLLLDGLSSSTMKVTVACPCEDPYWSRYKDCSVVSKMVEIPHRAFSFTSLRLLLKELKKEKIDLIHSHGKGAGLYSRLLSILSGVPVVHTMHGVHIGDYSRMKSFLYRFYERFMSLFTQAVISVSQAERQEIISLGLAPESIISTILNGIKIPEKLDGPKGTLVPGLPLSANGALSEEFIWIVNVNRFNRQKNPWLMIDICHELKNSLNRPFRFLVLGDGQHFQHFTDRLKEENIDQYFHFTGSVPNPFDYYRGAWVFLSTALWEGLPLAPLEAMACELPLVLTDVTGNNEVVTHGENGYLFSSDDGSEGAARIISIANDECLKKKLGSTGRQLACTEFGQEKMVQSVMRLYLEMCDRFS